MPLGWVPGFAPARAPRGARARRPRLPPTLQHELIPQLGAVPLPGSRSGQDPPRLPPPGARTGNWEDKHGPQTRAGAEPPAPAGRLGSVSGSGGGGGWEPGRLGSLPGSGRGRGSSWVLPPAALGEGSRQLGARMPGFSLGRPRDPAKAPCLSCVGLRVPGTGHRAWVRGHDASPPTCPWELCWGLAWSWSLGLVRAPLAPLPAFPAAPSCGTGSLQGLPEHRVA